MTSAGSIFLCGHLHLASLPFRLRPPEPDPSSLLRVDVINVDYTNIQVFGNCFSFWLLRSCLLLLLHGTTAYLVSSNQIGLKYWD